MTVDAELLKKLKEIRDEMFFGRPRVVMWKLHWLILKLEKAK